MSKHVWNSPTEGHYARVPRYEHRGWVSVALFCCFAAVMMIVSICWLGQGATQDATGGTEIYGP